MIIEVFLIRHKETGKLMPLMRRGKGYSHWNPSKQDRKITAETDSPRIFTKKSSAEKAVTGWFLFPNADYRGYTTFYGEDDYDLVTKDDGRKKEDLEIITAKLVFDE